MELGHIKLRSQGVNILHGAIHEDHGLVWTEGQGIFLTPVSLFQGEVENQEHSKLGEFDRGVKSIHWSDNISAGLCYMCVVHDRNISIWKVEGRQPKLSFKQIRKINIQPISKGCLWNPGRDILCVLCPQQSSLYYSHVHNKGSQVLLQLDREKIRCGCWSTDGLKFIVCIGTSLMVYHWSDIDNSITTYTAVPWTVPGLLGHISSVVAISSDRIITAAELPLESLCKQQDTFLIPDLLNSNSNGPVRDELTEGEVIRPKGQQTSATESLLNLQRNPDSVLEDSSRLDCIDLSAERKPTRVSSVNVKGVLTPDLLLFQANLNQVLVGSNVQTLIQVYLFDRKQFTKTCEITLDKEERPKGLAGLPKSCCHDDQDGVLIVSGKRGPADVAFPSSSSTVTMKSVLKFFNLKHGRHEKAPLTHTQSVPSIPVSVSANGNQNNKDFDSIYDSVINFDTNLKNSTSYIRVADNKENNNTSKRASKERSDSFKAESVLSEVQKANGCHGDSKHVNGNTEIENKAPVPPKRPVRKKRSMRQNREDLSRQSSGSSQGKTEATTKMPMEYLSDSPEMSPRDHVHYAESNSSSEKSPDLNMKNVENETSAKHVTCENECKEQSKILPESEIQVESVMFKSVSKVSEHSAPPNEELSREISSLKIGIQNDVHQGSVKITEVGGDEKISELELEVEKTDFDSHKRNFGQVNFQKLCQEETENEKVMENYLEEKLKSKSVASNAVTETVGAQKLSISTESLDDIDKLLKEQNEKITKLQEQMNALSRRVDESSCVLPTRYQSINKPDTVQICFWCKDGFKIEKKFLLDNGRLQLEQIKQSFSLETVEMHIDDEACVVGCNIDGYIPVRFEPSSTITISGKPALT
ncbi:uncharacterized protein LOC123552802 isoform X2 [Mercenaria mercenaria]|uniref:uncharacterized protein LOC123552802 isoform X2 n=1 Tax=Mercenaria mercenaria TaxID=6596 RepID=UPI00234FA779|nr:uncharacterized protein LOC123552802 isoform X2 [Mercenaria mercenaria]